MPEKAFCTLSANPDQQMINSFKVEHNFQSNLLYSKTLSVEEIGKQPDRPSNPKCG